MTNEEILKLGITVAKQNLNYYRQLSKEKIAGRFVFRELERAFEDWMEDHTKFKRDCYFVAEERLKGFQFDVFSLKSEGISNSILLGEIKKMTACLKEIGYQAKIYHTDDILNPESLLEDNLDKLESVYMFIVTVYVDY